MNLFNYLMAKKGHNTSVIDDDLFSYLLGKGIKEPKIVSGTTINITDVTKEKIGSLKLDKESTQDGTPTPETPVEVNTVTGNVGITISDGNNTRNYTIPLGNNEIAGIGNYKDELIVDKNGHCWLNKKIKKLILNGTETWNRQSTREHCFYTTINTISLTGLSDHYIKILASGFDNTMGIYLTNTNRIIISDLRFSTIEDFKQWLTTNNVIVYYAIQEPELIDLNYTVDIRLFKGNSEISNSDNMNMILEYY